MNGLLSVCDAQSSQEAVERKLCGRRARDDRVIFKGSDVWGAKRETRWWRSSCFVLDCDEMQPRMLDHRVHPMKERKAVEGPLCLHLLKGTAQSPTQLDQRWAALGEAETRPDAFL